ncbi:hypothetical protein GGF42_000793 [Coemansia sp. RSA 2424]|nr:hypothetical protein GGF42_000793 [Coemansia sp. RSA 2424]
MNDGRDTGSEMDWQSFAASDAESAFGAPAARGDNTPQGGTAGDSSNQIIRFTCARCRLLELPCNRASPSCKQCADMSLDCMYYRLSSNDRLFKTLPTGATMSNAPDVPNAWRVKYAWKNLKASDEFLRDDIELPRAPEDVYSTTENPLRRQLDPSQADMLTSSLLKDVIDQYPEEADRVQLPLPSSELLASISSSIARREAEKLMQESPSLPSLNDSMSSSSLLALGKQRHEVQCTAAPIVRFQLADSCTCICDV